MKDMKKTCAFLATLGLLALPAMAQQAFEVPVEGSVLPGWVHDNGSRTAALHLELAPGWKTYWRAPGDAGIPPRFDWRGSSNLGTVAISWPTPKVFDLNGMRSVGYENALTIPLQITPKTAGQPVRLRARMELGICADVCIPHELSFDAVIDSTETQPVPAIAAALAQRPYTASEAGVRTATCRISPTDDGLRIEAQLTMPSAGGTEYVVIEPGPGDIWVSEAETRRNGNSLIAVSEMIEVNGGTIALDRSAVRITVLGAAHAVDIRGCTAG